MHIFHNWNGCKCSTCGKVRDEGHQWEGCKCRNCNKKQHKWKYPGEIQKCESCDGNGLVHFVFNHPTNCLGCNGRGVVDVLTCAVCSDIDKRWRSNSIEPSMVSGIIDVHRDEYKRFILRISREIGLSGTSAKLLQNATWSEFGSSIELVEYLDRTGIEEDVKRLCQQPGVLMKIERLFSMNLTQGPWHTKVVLFRVLPAIIFDATVSWASQYQVEIC